MICAGLYFWCWYVIPGHSVHLPKHIEVENIEHHVNVILREGMKERHWLLVLPVLSLAIKVYNYSHIRTQINSNRSTKASGGQGRGPGAKTGRKPGV